MKNVPDYQDVLNAADRIKVVAIKTPLLQNQQLNNITGANIFIKPECLQRTGSFKFRGAYNAISMMKNAKRKYGVVACSSGNHAQGVAEAARLLDIKATIVMPHDSPVIKLERTRRSGADVITYDRNIQDRDAIASNICQDTGATYIHPFDNHNVIAGQGTTGLEIVSQLQEHSKGKTIKLLRALVCTGGGGLTSGLALALDHHFKGIKIHSVEPEGFDDYRRSLNAGERVGNLDKSGSICDALLTGSPGEIGFKINHKLLAEGLAVSDEQALKAVKFAFHELKLVVEPGGAVALAALLNSGNRWSGENIVCIISGGNIDPQMMTRALAL
ncbi:MAG: threonine/serine dehydratase [Hyphomicrobiales bacterium]|nr:threonine/serine dehydratase [Hyphomicrobiales bacterium]